MGISTLIVDDDEDIRLLIQLIIDAANDGLFVQAAAATGAEALEKLDECDPDVVVLDEMMPGMSGLEAAARIRETRPGLPMILCSAYLDEDVRARAAQLGIECLAKEEMPQMPAAIRRLAGKR